MYDSVIIKKIGDIDIDLSRSTLYKSTWFTPLYWVLPFFICYGGSILFSSILCSVIENCSNYNLNNLLIVSLIFGGVGGFFIWALNIGTKEIPSYSVYTRWDIDFKSICIPMTTPERDQIEICKAAKEIEMAIIKHNRKLFELEQIAFRCK